MLRSLAIESNNANASSLRPVDALALPLAVETAAHAVQLGEELRILINQPGLNATAQLRLLPTLEMEELPPLPLVAAGVAACVDELLVTGADEAGVPVVMRVAADGKLLWQFKLEGASPARWPAPFCATQSHIVWQTSLDKLEVASCGPNGIVASRSFNIGGPPLSVAAGSHAVWAAWSDATQIHCLEITEHAARDINLAATFPNGVAIGACNAGACLAWMQAGSVFFTRVNSETGLTENPIKLDLENAGGTLAVVSGPHPLVRASRADFDAGEEVEWTNAIVLPCKSPVIFKGFVHALAWWGEMLAVIGWEQICLLKHVDDES